MSVASARNPKGKVQAKATSATLVKANVGRKCLYVTNPSTKDAWLALGPEAKKEEGIYLKKEGGSAVISGSGDEGYTGEVAVVTTEGEGNVTFAEV